MASHFLLVQNDASELNARGPSGGYYRVSYHLSAPLVFSEPHLARLTSLSGPSNVTIVYADFVAPQNVNGRLHQLLGISSTKSIPTWMPLDRNQISSEGELTFEFASGAALPVDQKICAVIEFAPASRIYGHGRASS